jgi:SAM-dependent methyltransferase
MAWALHEERGIMEIKEAVPLNLVGLFVMCMFFHGELAARKPAPRHLTSFYLMVALGGALGGIAVGLLSVKVFNTYYEFGVGLIATLLIAAWLTRLMHSAVPMLMLAAVGFAGYHVYAYIDYLARDTRVMTRNFYGTLRVKDIGAEGENDAVRRLVHGVIMHGEQYRAAGRRNEPTTYYGATSGIGRALKALEGSALRVGVVGLGTGTLALYGRPGDVYRFYEINPQVVTVAEREFTFLADSGAKIEHVLGDARLSMEREPPQEYDVLVVDAFSSDSIPVHLLTAEAFAVYFRHLQPGGILAVHISNRYLDLKPVLKEAATRFGKAAQLVDDDSDAERGTYGTTWVLFADAPEVFAQAPLKGAGEPLEADRTIRVWTDDYSDLYRILK